MRYGADYPNIGYEVEHAGKPAPNAPYSTTPYTLHPTPYTLHPTPYTLLPTPPKIYKSFQNML
ncbi:hypothetical protein [Moorena sp. SIO3I6]|uniref:hypothetical protein n=1 Tax=Moorena sp. SIO3I6 TaxID=2607831 RepID=UPI0013F863C9|nr:hypothetical protein [Moorena sp. SIO3I6]NEP28654.1 hypothetical protein [Moorena sp. SIO3I6]